MSQPQVLVCGEGFAPYLIAALLARFGPTPEAISVESTPERAPELPETIHPPSLRWLDAIAVTPKRLLSQGAEEVQTWADGDQLPFLYRSKRTAGLTMTRGQLHSVFQAVCSAAGVQQGRSDAALSISTQCGKAASVDASVPSSVRPDLHVLTLVESARSMAFSMPGREPSVAEIDELKRLATRAHPAIEDMSELLAGRDLAPRVHHRIQVWTAIGRVCPYDDDPFDPGTWQAALAATNGTPSGSTLLQAVRGQA